MLRSNYLFSKTYASENAYRSHLNSKRHRDNEVKMLNKPNGSEKNESAPQKIILPIQPSLIIPEDASDDAIERTIDAKIAASRSRLPPSSCLFCSNESSSIDQNLAHMASTHSFFIPDVEYLIDLPGFISYLGEKIAVGSACLYCSSRGKEFRSLDAVRKHMIDKSHCKIAYESEEDRLEYSDFYDFSGSYPPGNKSDEEDWEDVDEIDQADEVVDDLSETEGSPDNQITYGDTDYELVLPSGVRIGHRSMRRYYAQSFRSMAKGKNEDAKSGAALVRRLLKDKNSALVPRRGGFGAFGGGTDVVKARNRGEAKEAGRHVREFRDQKRREEFKTKIAFIHNHQKHYRDPCKYVRQRCSLLTSFNSTPVGMTLALQFIDTVKITINKNRRMLRGIGYLCATRENERLI